MSASYVRGAKGRFVAQGKGGRVHRGGASKSAEPVADFGPFQVISDSTEVSTAFEAIGARIEDDKDVMHRIADELVNELKENILTRSFRPLLPESLERRRFAWNPPNGIGTRGPVSGGRPLLSSGALVRNIKPRSRTGYAAARRGNMEWYAFLHDWGVGRLDPRRFADLDPAQEERIVTLYDEWVGTVIEEGE